MFANCICCGTRFQNVGAGCLNPLTLSWRRPLSYRNQSIDFQSKSIDWLLHDSSLRHEKVKRQFLKMVKHVHVCFTILWYWRLKGWSLQTILYALIDLKEKSVCERILKLIRAFEIIQALLYYIVFKYNSIVNRPMFLRWIETDLSLTRTSSNIKYKIYNTGYKKPVKEKP